MQSQAIVIHGVRDVRLEPREVAAPDVGEVLVRMRAGGICGSDLHYYGHGGFGDVRLREPMVLGHEVAGEIEALGSDVDGLEEGQLVAVSPSRPCGSCRFCQDGAQNHCEAMRFYGSAMPFPHIQGAFRDRLVVQASQCVPAEGLTPGEAAMAEPLAVCLHGLRQAGALLGKRVLVTGCGPIGLLTILAARRAGAAEIIASDLADFTRRMAQDCGADAVLNAAHDDIFAPWSTGKGQIDVHMECSGAEAAIRAALPALRPGGVLVQLGLGGDMTLPVQAMTAKEITLRGSFRFHAEFATAVRMMQAGLIDVRPLITHRFELDALDEAFETASDRNQAVKAQFKF